MSGKTDVRVRVQTTYTVSEYTESPNIGGSRVLATHDSLAMANEVATALFKAAEQPRELTVLDVVTASSDQRSVPWLHGALQALGNHPEGTELRVSLLPSPDPENPRARLTWLLPVTSAVSIIPDADRAEANGSETYMRFGDPLSDRLTQVETVVASLKDSIMKEVSRLNLPETLDDLSRETTKRGIEAYMAIQAVAKDYWQDHEIEAMAAAISKRTGKAKIDLRSMFENARERATKAKDVFKTTSKSQFDQDLADLTDSERLYCNHRADGWKPIAAAKAAGYSHPGDIAHTLETTPTIRRVIAALMESEPTTGQDAQQNVTSGALRLENATQEFFALNVGFYGMSVDQAAAQMSLTDGTGDALIADPEVSKRIAYLRTCRAGAGA